MIIYICIRYDGKVETIPTCQRQLLESVSNFHQIDEHIEYGKGSGQYSSLLMNIWEKRSINEIIQMKH